MFDFPQPGEKYRLGHSTKATIIGILYQGIPYDMPYRCPSVTWDPCRKSYTIVIRIELNNELRELPLYQFLNEYRCIAKDKIKRDERNRHAVLLEISQCEILKRYREKNINHYPPEVLAARYKTRVEKTKVWRDWRVIPVTKNNTGNYRDYL
ncbi:MULTISPECIES: hypothetical protein [Hafnia]|jgi:hypothetical protein|uniref:hypothetical protein n=1 Tax=Hafnia TaxID=568 RepID=UPI00057EEF04|nr:MULTISPECIES: hypothetical protein [Hafnia]KAA0261777.1 hypothetical protein ERL64_13950 [Hafnia alvei]KHS50051.1 hypothetical protein RN38_03560 [Hafnia paralvei]TBL55339.1 hypothetical protein EYZ00_04765 [Hafnia paralvei]